ncbi:unnamed protein product, partial [Choristocarpus tenellus]
MSEDITVDDIKEAFPAVFQKFESVDPQEIVRALDKYGFEETEDLFADLDALAKGTRTLTLATAAACDAAMDDVEASPFPSKAVFVDSREIDEPSPNEPQPLTLDTEFDKKLINGTAHGSEALKEEFEDAEQGELFVGEIIAQEEAEDLFDASEIVENPAPDGRGPRYLVRFRGCSYCHLQWVTEATVLCGGLALKDAGAG